MATPYLSEIRLISFNFPPKGWAFCNGQLLPINQNQALFSLLGTTYGGNGQTTFALPNLQGRAALHFGNAFSLGQTGGEIIHTLSSAEMPQHYHPVQGTGVPGTSQVAANNYLAAHRGGYADSQDTTLNASSLTATGGSQPHENMPPYLVMNYIIALQGIFPTQN
jgi:microcystin-dependent protein